MKTLGVSVIVLCIIINSVCFAKGANTPCVKDRSLTCLQANFNTLYKDNYSLFWTILHKSEKHIYKSRDMTSVFLKLANIRQVNAEFSEYYSEVVESVIENKPNVFFETMISLDETTISNVLSYLMEPTFIDKSDLDLIFKKYGRNAKYSKITKAYFRGRPSSP